MTLIGFSTSYLHYYTILQDYFSLNDHLDVSDEWLSSQEYFILWPTVNDMVAFTWI